MPHRHCLILVQRLAQRQRPSCLSAMRIIIDDFVREHNTTPLPAGVSTLTRTWKAVADIMPNQWAWAIDGSLGNCNPYTRVRCRI
jgi:hypothetical protein